MTLIRMTFVTNTFVTVTIVLATFDHSNLEDYIKIALLKTRVKKTVLHSGRLQPYPQTPDEAGNT